VNGTQGQTAFTVIEVASALRCSPLFLVKEARRGLLVIREINNRTRIILPHDLADYLESKRLFKPEPLHPSDSKAFAAQFQPPHELVSG
jgi:hypothetical protein